MRAYSAETNIGRTIAGDDIHHKTADCTKSRAKAAAKSQRKAARQFAKREIVNQQPAGQDSEL